MKSVPDMKRFQHFLTNLFLSAVLFLPMALPYRWRVPVVGWIVSRLVAPAAGYRKRIRRNLNHVYPSLSEAEVRYLCRAVPDNAARTLIEVYSGDTFVRRIARTPPRGPGVDPIRQALAERRPIVVFSGHFGNYDAPRAALRLMGHEVGALYRPFTNPYFDRHYRNRISAIAAPIFPQGRRGLAEMVQFLRQGNTIALLTDQYAGHGMKHDFLGKPSRTPTSAAAMALKYDALLVPVYGIRQDDGLSFDILFEEPIPHTTEEQMTLDLTGSLERQVEQHPEQWLWIHRKWKPDA